jgi:hypothetical protein
MATSPLNWDFDSNCFDADYIEESECGVVRGEIETGASGFTSCSRCGLVLDIESDLDAGIQLGDPYSQGDDDDNDGNVDNLEFNNVQDVIRPTWSSEEKYRNEVKNEFLRISNIFKDQIAEVDEDSDDDYRKHQENNPLLQYVAYIYANLEELVGLYMFYSHHGQGPNIFKKKGSARLLRCLAILSMYRQNENHIFNGKDMIEKAGADYSKVMNIVNQLIISKYTDRKSRVTHYIKAIAEAMKQPKERTEEILRLWERDEEMDLAAKPPVLGLAWVLAYLEVFHGEKPSVSGLSKQLGVNRETVSKVKKEYVSSLQTIMTAL